MIYILSKRLIAILITAFFALNVGAVEVTKHPSGATLILQHMPQKPVSSIQIWVGTGAINEGEKYHGLSHFLEHLLFKGSQKYPLGTIDKTIEGFGGRVNAATSKDFTYYYITSANQFATQALDILADMVLNPLIDTDEMLLEKDVVIEEIRRGLDNPYRQVYERLAANLFAEHPYARNVIAHEAAITNCTRDLLLEYHQQFYLPANFAIVVVGGFDKEALLSKIDIILDPYSKQTKNYSKPAYPKLNSLVRPIFEQIKDPKVKIKSAVWASRGPIGGAKDTYALDLLGELLSAGKQSLWYREFVESGHLLSAWASYSTNLSHGAFYLAARYQNNQNYSDVMTLLNQSLNKLHAQLLVGELDNHIQMAKERLRNSKIFRQQKVDAIATRLGIAYTVTDLDYDNSYIKEIAKVDANSIARVLKSYILRPAGVGIELVPAN